MKGQVDTQWWEYEGTSGCSIVCLCVQWYYAVWLNENGLCWNRNLIYVVWFPLIYSVSSSSIWTFHLISSSFFILAFYLWTSFCSASLWSNRWSLCIMLMFTALNCSHLSSELERFAINSSHAPFSQSYRVPFWDPWHDAFHCLAQFAILLLGFSLLTFSNQQWLQFSYFVLLVRVDN